jgi:hypothetical protein
MQGSERLPGTHPDHDAQIRRLLGTWQGSIWPELKPPMHESKRRGSTTDLIAKEHLPARRFSRGLWHHAAHRVVDLPIQNVLHLNQPPDRRLEANLYICLYRLICKSWKMLESESAQAGRLLVLGHELAWRGIGHRRSAHQSAAANAGRRWAATARRPKDKAQSQENIVNWPPTCYNPLHDVT